MAKFSLAEEGSGTVLNAEYSIGKAWQRKVKQRKGSVMQGLSIEL